jgi:hypothetical protein
MILVTVAAFLLVGAGVAVGHGFDSKAVKQVSATFTATTVGNLRTASCTGADGTYTKAHATYGGSFASSEPALNGAARIEASSFVNSTTGVGTVWGSFRVDNPDGRDTRASFQGVLAGGMLVGLSEGRAKLGRDGVRLLANVSANFSAAAGFSNGKVGGGTAAGEAILITPGGCHTPKPPKPERVKARGAITAVSPTSIAAAGVTCAVPSGLASAVGKLKTGDIVTIHCDVAGGTSTLTRVSTHKR